ncbi:MAG: histidine triad nucleotide-binding protein [Pirellulaceae bacterium]|nr:histidine triad nucleotide-binding protein [Pirellulaceae bacterium]
MSTIFKKIIDREIPAAIVYEDDLCLAFRDIAPQAPTHILVIPKKEIASLADLTDSDEQIVGRCIMAAHKIAADENLSSGYRLVCNSGDDGGQEVPHLHFHLLGGRKMTWPPG